jgi:small conductance mechanosensitive channel
MTLKPTKRRPGLPNALRLVLLLLALLTGFGPMPALSENGATAAELEALIAKLEDDQRREALLGELRALLAASQAQASGNGPGDDLKSAAAQGLNLIAERVADAGEAVTTLAAGLSTLPQAASEAAVALAEPATRERWLTVAGRLLAVLGSGFLAAALVARATRRLLRPTGSKVASLGRRLLLLCGRALLDLLPVVVFAAFAYLVLSVVDVGNETRLVAVALINASIVSRLVLAVSAFLLAPTSPALRLWRLDDATARYLHHWLRRLAFVGVYGFFVLQAGLLLGLDPGVYRVLLNLLGFALVVLLLFLIGRNRRGVAAAIAGQRTAEAGPAVPFQALRAGFARVWHLAAGAYLVVVFLVWSARLEEGARFVVSATLISLAVLAGALLLTRASDRLRQRFERLRVSSAAPPARLDSRFRRYVPALHRLVKALLAIGAVLLVLDAWGVDAVGWLLAGPGRALLSAFLNIALILLVAVFAWELAAGSIERYLGDAADAENGGRSPRIRTLLTVARNALLVFLTLLAGLMVLSELGVDIAPLLAGAGVVGLAIGFGAQRMVQDVINGAFILFQDLMSVGDVVKLGDTAGLVEALSIRTVRLRDLSGVVHTIPFSSIEGVSNLTRDFSFHVFDLGVAYREDVDEVIALIEAVGRELRADPVVGRLILEPLEIFGLDAFGDSAIVIKGRIKTRPIRQWQVGRAFNRLIKQRFDEHGIEIPFPHRTLYFGQDKQGGAPPAFVQAEALLRQAEQGAARAPAGQPQD